MKQVFHFNNCNKKKTGLFEYNKEEIDIWLQYISKKTISFFVRFFFFINKIMNYIYRIINISFNSIHKYTDKLIKFIEKENNFLSGNYMFII